MVELREASTGDSDAVLSVHREAIRSVTSDRYTDEEVAAWVAAQDDPHQYPFEDETQYIAVAETADERIVGFVGVDLTNGVLETLYVHPDVQGDGIGTTLLTHAENTVRKHGHSVLIVGASLNAIPFYRRHGYSLENETFMLAMKDTSLEFVRMEKTLN